MSKKLRDSSYEMQRLVQANNPDNEWRDKAYAKINFNPPGEMPRLNMEWREAAAWNSILAQTPPDASQ